MRVGTFSHFLTYRLILIQATQMAQAGALTLFLVRKWWGDVRNNHMASGCKKQEGRNKGDFLLPFVLFFLQQHQIIMHT